MKLWLKTLEERRELMNFKFAKQCLKLEKVRGLFPRKVSCHDMLKRDSDTFDIVKPKTSRYQLSEIPVMLNHAEREKRHQCWDELFELFEYSNSWDRIVLFGIHIRSFSGFQILFELFE